MQQINSITSNNIPIGFFGTESDDSTTLQAIDENVMERAQTSRADSSLHMGLPSLPNKPVKETSFVASSAARIAKVIAKETSSSSLLDRISQVAAAALGGLLGSFTSTARLMAEQYYKVILVVTVALAMVAYIAYKRFYKSVPEPVRNPIEDKKHLYDQLTEVARRAIVKHTGVVPEDIVSIQARIEYDDTVICNVYLTKEAGQRLLYKNDPWQNLSCLKSNFESIVAPYKNIVSPEYVYLLQPHIESSWNPPEGKIHFKTYFVAN